MKPFAIKLMFVSALLAISGLALACQPTTVRPPEAGISPEAKVNTEPVRINGLPVQGRMGDYITFDSYKALEKRADLIIIGTATQEFTKSQPVVFTEDQQSSRPVKPDQSVLVVDSRWQELDSFTLTSVRVAQTIKGQRPQNNIEVIQAGAVIDDAKQGRYINANIGFSPMQPGSQYLLFLAKLDSKTFSNMANAYSIMSVNQGKFNLDDTDLYEAQVDLEDGQHRRLKATVLDYYQKQIKPQL